MDTARLATLNPDLSSAHTHHKPAQATVDISEIANP
jgi:hypothetical protein